MTNRRDPLSGGMSEDQLMQLFMRMVTTGEGMGGTPSPDEIAFMRMMMAGAAQEEGGGAAPRMQPTAAQPICHSLEGYDIVDAQAMHELHPMTFRVPTIEESRNVVVGDKVKIGVPGEKFWVEVTELRDGMVYGTVGNRLQHVEWPVGKVIHFPPRAINTINVPHSVLGRHVQGESNPPMPNVNELGDQQKVYFIGHFSPSPPGLDSREDMDENHDATYSARGAQGESIPLTASDFRAIQSNSHEEPETDPSPICHTFEGYDIIDGQAMQQKNPEFQVPSLAECRRVKEEDKVRIAVQKPKTANSGEKFWLEVISVDGNMVTATVMNYLVRIPWAYGKEIKLPREAFIETELKDDNLCSGCGQPLINGRCPHEVFGLPGLFTYQSESVIHN